MLLDDASIHKGPSIRELCRRYPRLHLEFLPPYAPELNPDEGVWADAKARLANGRPDDLAALYRRLYATLHGLQRSPRRLRRCVLDARAGRAICAVVEAALESGRSGQPVDVRHRL